MTPPIGEDVDWSEIATTLRRIEPSVGLRGANLPGSQVDALRQAAVLCELRDREARALRAEAEWPKGPDGSWPERVCVESPLRGEYERNVLYADACMLDCLQRGEAPFLGHLIYPRVLDDEDAEDRARGIESHLAWLRGSHRVAIYIDLGVSTGMAAAVAMANELRLPVVERTLGAGWIKWIGNARSTSGFHRQGNGHG